MNTILTYHFNDKDFETSFEAWEAEIEKYDTEQIQKFPDEIKIGVLTSKAPPQLQQYLMLNTDLQTPYNEIRKIVIDYFRNGRVINQLSKQNRSTSGPMDVDAVLSEKIAAIWKKDERSLKFLLNSLKFLMQ